MPSLRISNQKWLISRKISIIPTTWDSFRLKLLVKWLCVSLMPNRSFCDLGKSKLFADARNGNSVSRVCLQFHTRLGTI